MADVYVLASPAPTLWVYPSALHVDTPVQPPTPGGGGPIHRRPPQLRKPHRRRDDDETALAVLAAI